MKVRVTIIHREIAEMDIGNLPINMIRDVLTKNDGTFDGNWGPSDVPGQSAWTVDSIDVEEVPQQGKGR